MWGFRIAIAVAVLMCCLNASHGSKGQYLPLYNSEQWLQPLNQRAFQKLWMQRMLQVMDLQADPCEDFFQFACGNYKTLFSELEDARATYPASELSLISKGFVNECMDLDSGIFRTATERKLRDFLQSCINSKNNLQSTADFVKSFGSWPALDRHWSERTFDWIETVVEMLRTDAESIFVFEPETGKRDRVDIGITSLVISKTEFFNLDYGRTSDSFVEILKEIGENVVPNRYLNNMIPRVKTFFNQVLQIAENSETEDEEYEFYLHELQQRAPGCDFARLFSLITGRGYETTETITVTDINYVENACQLIQRTDKKTLADYLLTLVLIYDHKIRQVDQMDEDALKKHCETEAKLFFLPVLTGMFARDYVPVETRQEVFNLVSDLQKVAVQMILSNVSWLDEHTRRKAANKMAVVTNRIGYPDYMVSEEELTKLYSKVNIDTMNYLQNWKHLKGIEFKLFYDVIGKDYSNIYYDPLNPNPEFQREGRGVLRVQAAMLLPPFYHKFAPSFIKHSTVLSILGHELMHNFDVKGINIDEHGKENQWMTANRYFSYDFRSECFYSQFQKFTLNNSDVHVKGALTMGENVADFDGVKLAFQLFKQWITDNPDKVWEEEFTFAPLQMTHEQAFFLNFAQQSCDISSHDDLVEQIKTNVHAPNKFRIIGSLSNLPDFATAYNCPANSKMNPAEKCTYFFD